MSGPLFAASPAEAPPWVDVSGFGAVEAMTVTESGWTIDCQRGRVVLSLEQFNSLRRTLERPAT